MAEQRCKQVFALLSEYLDGELKARNCRELEEHLRGCRPCLRYLRTLKLTREACRRYSKIESSTFSTDPCPPLLAQLAKKLQQQFRSKHRLRGKRLQRRVWPKR